MSNTDERAAFEAYAGDQGYPLRRLHDEADQGYADVRTEGAWLTWQARAALSAAPAEPVSPGAPQDDPDWEYYPMEGIGLVRRRKPRGATPPPQPAAAERLTEDQRMTLRDVIADSLGRTAYFCTRVWEAWNVGTMSRDDFHPITEDNDALLHIVDVVEAALYPRVIERELSRVPDMQPVTRQHEPASEQQKLRNLADRIDFDKQWMRAGTDRLQGKMSPEEMDRLQGKMSPEEMDRLDAGVALRRYSDLLEPGRWLVYPPRGGVSFSAKTLAAAVEMAQRDGARRRRTNTGEPVMSDPMRGKYVRKKAFGAEFQKAQARLAPLGGKVEPGVFDYEAFTYTAPGLKLIFYPHRTTAGNYHIRIRHVGKPDPKALRAAIFALAENTCTFTYPADYALHGEAVRAALDRQYAAMRSPS